MTAAERAFRESLELADLSGHLRERLAARWLLAMVLVVGPTPVRSCIEVCEELVSTLGTEHPGLLTEPAVLSAMEGRHEEARGSNERARRIFVDEMHARRMLMFVAGSQATVELLAGDLSAAERELRTRLAFARASGERDHVSQTAARLAACMRAQGRSDEAASLALLSAQTAPVEGVAAQALSRAAMAGVASDSGDRQEAERLARKAVGLVPGEMLNLRADVLVELAEVLRAGDHEQQAKDAISEALRLYELKGNVASASRMRRLDRSSAS